jgi:hypothetical protein
MRNRKLHKFIFVTIIVPLEHDSAIRRENTLGDACSTIFGATAKQLRKSRAQPARAGSLLLGLRPLRQIFLGQRRTGRLGLHHDARNSPAAGFFDRVNAVDAAPDLLAVAVQREAAP